jgi:uncharacterized protein involved in outer membrane biogenesis
LNAGLVCKSGVIMSTFMQRALIALAAILVLIAAAALFGRHLLGVHVKSRIETDASAALGMEVRIGGSVALRFFPGLHVTLKDVRIRNQGADVASVGEVKLGIELRSLLRKDLKTEGVKFNNARISIERDKSGHLNIDRPPKPDSSPSATDIASVSFAQSSLFFSDAQSGKDFKAENCGFEVKDLRLAAATSADLMRSLSFAGKLACEHFRTERLVGSSVKVEVRGSDGVFKLEPITLEIFGGQGRATVTADFTAAESVYRIHASISKLQIADFSKTQLPQKLGEGTLDFATNLAMRGTLKSGVIRSATGEAQLHGDNLVLEVGDLDKEFSHYESTQSFNLLDVGAFFLAGPIGLALTKGYDYSRILKKSEGRTTIRTLVSKWKVQRGVAEAEDVALATAENRVAMKGGLDFENDSYEDVTVALVGPKGCVRVQQKIHGSFRKPEVEKPNVVTTVAGPARKLINKGKSLLGAKCTVFYSGSVAAPK